MTTGEVIAEAGTTVTKDLAVKIQNAAIPSVMIQTDVKNEKILSNLAVDINAYVDFDCKSLGILEDVYYPVLAEILGASWASRPMTSSISFTTRSGSALGRSILLITGRTSRSWSRARYTFASVWASIP